MGRKTEKLDVDIVVPLNAIEIGKKIAENIGSKFIILDKKREVVRIFLIIFILILLIKFHLP